MLSKFIELISREAKLIDELIVLGAKQQSALIKFDSVALENITMQQEKLVAVMKNLELQRVKYLTTWLKITTQEASSFKLSKLEKMLKGENKELVKNLRLRLKNNLGKLYYINALNRTLSNRARNSVKEILAAFTGGPSKVCNVKI